MSDLGLLYDAASVVSFLDSYLFADRLAELPQMCFFHLRDDVQILMTLRIRILLERIWLHDGVFF